MKNFVVSGSPLLVLLFLFGTAEGGEWHWDVVEKPPTLSNPKLIDASKLHAIHSAGWKRFFTRRATDKLLCDGRIYKIILDDDVDAIVYMSGDQPLVYPVHVTGGQNVRIVGLQFELETQPGCDVGELPNLPVKKHPNANIHPRIPGAIALRVEQHRTTFMEGLHIDVRGHEADCIVSRNPDDMTDATAQQQRDVIVQNTWCSGVEGLGKSKIGDGVHGDLFQNQGRDIMRRLVFENVSMRTSQEGIVLHGKGRLPGAVSLVMRRYDYTWDSRYVGDDDYEHFGLAFAGEAPTDGWTLDTIYIDAYRDGFDYMNIDEQRYGNSPSSRVRQHTEIFSGPPPGGAFAPPEHTGVHYVTPHEPLPRD